jgi:hypothetical protein
MEQNIKLTNRLLVLATIQFIKHFYGKMIPREYDLCINFLKFVLKYYGYKDVEIEATVKDILKKTINDDLSSK